MECISEEKWMQYHWYTYADNLIMYRPGEDAVITPGNSQSKVPIIRISPAWNCAAASCEGEEGAAGPGNHRLHPYWRPAQGAAQREQQQQQQQQRVELDVWWDSYLLFHLSIAGGTDD